MTAIDDVRARTGRNHMEVAYLGDVLIGCTGAGHGRSRRMEATVTMPWKT
ncbi:hypothetical protein [Streptomyces sp. NPDC008141]